MLERNLGDLHRGLALLPLIEGGVPVEKARLNPVAKSVVAQPASGASVDQGLAVAHGCPDGLIAADLGLLETGTLLGYADLIIARRCEAALRIGIEVVAYARLVVRLVHRLVLFVVVLRRWSMAHICAVYLGYNEGTAPCQPENS